MGLKRLKEEANRLGRTVREPNRGKRGKFEAAFTDAGQGRGTGRQAAG